jgi:methyl-accepting chemotaxis protein
MLLNMVNMVNIETGLRGFVTGGSEGFLDPFKAGKEAFGKYHEKAKSLTFDNAKQQERLTRLEGNHKEFLSVPPVPI